LGEALRFHFKKKKLEALYTEEKDAHKYPGVVDDFFEVMAIIDAAVDERDLYAQKGLRFEKLSGKRAKQGQRSLRLNNQWRLIVTVDEDEQGNYLTIIDIEDYH
jgi:toxin HigB-1